MRNGGTGTVVVSTIRDDVIVIPQTATFELQNKVFVYRVVEGKTQQTEISVAPLDDGKTYIVESGLQKGDIIIAEGAGLLKEGMEIAPSPLPLWGSASKEDARHDDNNEKGKSTPPKGERGGGRL